MSKDTFNPDTGIQEGSKTFVKAVRAECCERDWSEYQLAREVGITYEQWTSIVNYEVSPSIELMVKVASHLGLRVEFQMRKLEMPKTRC